MLFWLPFHGPLHWALDALVTVAVFVATAMYGLRKHRLPSAPRHVVPARGTVPEQARSAFAGRSFAAAGFRPLGVLTLWQATSFHAFVEVWVDTATSSTLAQTIFIQHKPDSTPVVESSLFTCVGNPASPAVVSLSSSARGVTSGSPPGDEAIFLPGMSLAQMSDLHRLHLASRPDGGARLPCTSLGEVIAILDWLGVRSEQWRLATGRIQRGPDGDLHLSWGQCGWWVVGHFPPGKQIRRWRRQRAGRQAAASWQRGLPAQLALH